MGVRFLSIANLQTITVIYILLIWFCTWAWINYHNFHGNWLRVAELVRIGENVMSNFSKLRLIEIILLYKPLLSSHMHGQLRFRQSHSKNMAKDNMNMATPRMWSCWVLLLLIVSCGKVFYNLYIKKHKKIMESIYLQH